MNDRVAGTALVSVQIPSLQMAEDELISVMQNSVYPGAAIASIKLALGYCRAQNLDPMTKPVHIVPMRVKVKTTFPNGKVKTENVTRDVIMPGIDLYRIKASRTGEHAGNGEVVWGPIVDEELGGEPKEEWSDEAQAYVKGNKTWDKRKVRFAEWCEFTVYRMVAGEPRAFRSGRVYWKECYATAANDTTLPNSMWLKRTFGQHEKCAEALALRRGFPEVGAQPTAEEMEGKTLDTGTVIDGATGAIVSTSPTIPGPQAKSAPRPPTTVSGEARREADENPTQPEPTAGSDAPTDGSGGEGPQAPKDDKPILDGQLRILRAKLKNAALTDIDACAHFQVHTLEELKFSQFDEVQSWIAERAAKLSGAPK